MINSSEGVRANRSQGSTAVSPKGRVGFFILSLYPQFITLTLGFYSLANAWQLQGIVFLQPIAFLFAVAMITLFFLRGICFPGRFIEEMHTPAAIVAYQTGIMTLYYVAQMISTHVHYVMGVFLWGVAVLVNGVFILRFLTVHLYSSFTFRHFNPPWFLMAMGVCVSALTGREMGIVLLPEWILGYSFAAFMLVVPLLFVRLFTLPLPLTCNLLWGSSAPGRL